MSQIILRDRFVDIDPKLDIRARSLEMLSIDVENVLTDYGNPEVLPGVAEHLEEIYLAGNGLKVVLITNNKSEAFLDEVVSQLPNSPEYINPSKDRGLRKKPSPDMFRHALNNMFPDVNPALTAHVDDQFKAYLGAKKAEMGIFYWTKPAGEHQHRGVKAFRPIEFGLIRPYVAIETEIEEVMRGDW